MSKVVFWDSGCGGSAEVAAAFGVSAGFHDRHHLLLTNCGQSGTGIEEGFPPRYEEMEDYFHSPVCDHGMEALLRLAESERLSKATIADYTYPLLQGRLDMAFGPKFGSDPWELIQSKEFAAIIQTAEQQYDFVVLQLSGSSALSYTAMLHPDDVIVAVLRQNRVEMDAFFEKINTANSLLHPVPIVAVIHQYDALSKWSLQNIKRRYHSQIPMIGIPYHTEFNDAWNGQDIISFFRRYRLLKGRGYEREQFLFSCKELVRFVLGKKEQSNHPVMDGKEKGA